MISDIETIGTAIVIVDVQDECEFRYADANQLALAYYHVTKTKFMGRNLEDFRGLTKYQIRGTKRTLALYKRCVKLRLPITTTTRSDFDNGNQKWAKHTLVPLTIDNKIEQIIITTTDITILKKSQHDLSDALTGALSGFVTICAWCKDIENETHHWLSIEEYVASKLEFKRFSHGMCPACREKHF